MNNDNGFFGCECYLPTSTEASDTRIKLSEVLETIRPKASPFGLFRIGGVKDGAYLIPDDLKNVKVCFSPGVSNRKSFEDELTTDHGITCHMCDFSSDESKLATPLISGKQTFDKLWLEPRSGAAQINLQSWINKFYPGGRRDLMLQMDIEGAEYRNILATPPETLALFRIIVIEVHGLSQLNSASVLNSVLHPFFSKIGKIFTCIHSHTNNYSEEFLIHEKQINLSDVLELTFIRTDIFTHCASPNLNAALVPHPLDITNATHREPIVLGEFWCGGARPIESKLKIIEDQLAYQIQKSVTMVEDVSVRVSKAVAEAFKLTLSEAVLNCVSVADSEREADNTIKLLEEVALGRSFNLSSSRGREAKSGQVAPRQSWFFHTQVGWDESITIELDETRVVGALVLVNRTDACFDRASVLCLSLSGDLSFADKVQRFYLNVAEDFTNGKKLHMLVPIPSAPARFVRLSSPLFTALHFSDVRVYASCV